MKQRADLQTMEDLTKEVIRLVDAVNKMCALQIVMIRAIAKVLEVEMEGNDD